MASDNFYYEVHINDPNLTEIMQFMVGTIEEQRQSTEGTYMLKTKDKDKTVRQLLKDYPKFNRNQVTEEIKKPKWRNDEF